MGCDIAQVGRVESGRMMKECMEPSNGSIRWIASAAGAAGKWLLKKGGVISRVV